MTDTSPTGEESTNRSEVAKFYGTFALAAWLQRVCESTAFSVAFGVVAPIVCFTMKPVLLPGDGSEIPGLGFISTFWIFSYGVVGLGIASLTLWLCCGPRLGSWCGIVSGDLLACAIFAGGLWLVMLPFSVIGLLVIIGVLGFVPLLTAATFGDHGIRAFHLARRLLGERMAWSTMLLGAVLVIGVPGSLQTWVCLAVRDAISDVALGEPSGMARLRALYPYTDHDCLVWTYAAEHDPDRKKRLAMAYRDLTGKDVENRLSRLAD